MNQLVLDIGGRLLVWSASELPSEQSTLLSLGLRDGQRLTRSIRNALDGSETHDDVIAAAKRLGDRRGEAVSVITAADGQVL